MAAAHSPCDNVPYGNLACPQTHPDRLAAVGDSLVRLRRRWSCRVLERSSLSSVVAVALNGLLQGWAQREVQSTSRITDCRSRN